jgi:hypothetical protein
MHSRHHSSVNWVSGFVFLIVALIQALRAAKGIPVTIGDFEVPIYASVIAAIVLAGLAYWNFHTARCCNKMEQGASGPGHGPGPTP